MAQEKEEAAIPDDAAPNTPARPAPPAENDSIVPADPEAALLPETASEGDAGDAPEEAGALPESAAIPSSEAGTTGDDTESPETISDRLSASDAGPESAISAEEPPKKNRRILPARASSPTLGTAGLSPKSSWTPLRKLILTIVIAWVLVAVGLLADAFFGRSIGISAVYLLAAIVAGIFPALELVRRLRQFAVPVASIPMVAALLAIVIGHWRDAAILLACYITLAGLRDWILQRSDEPLHALATARVSQAIPAGGERPLPIKELTVGDTVIVPKGEIVPLDGFVSSGATRVDQSIVTGSSEPVDKQRGSELYAGSRNLGDEIEMRVARRPSQRTITRTAKLARTAVHQPSRAQQILEELAGKYALMVLFTGVVAFLVLLLLGDHTWRVSLERVVAFLIAAAPAALLLTVATAYRAAMANAIRNGVLFRGQDELEILGTVQTIAFDKTGTLTQGRTNVTEVVNCATGWSDDEILQRAAAAELRSGHRLGRAIVETAQARELDIPEPSESIPSIGKGIVATVDGRTVAVGNANLFAELGVNIWRATEISADMRDEGHSAVLVGDKENVRGVIGVSDPLRPEAPDVVADLTTLRIRRTAMLTGDDDVVAQVIADEAGLHEVYADLLPEEKLGVVRQMEQGAPVGMIAGAGEHSPALVIATSGIALGSVVADVTREPAGVLLFGGELAELPFALWIAQTARRTTNIGLLLLIGMMAVLATGALVVGIPPLAVILVWFVVTLGVLLAGLRLLGATRRRSHPRVTTRLPSDDMTAVARELPKPRYVIDDEDDDEDEDDL